MNPRITVAKTAGFCFGVNRAVDMVYRLAETEQRVKTLGPIIHNPQVVEDLKRRGVEILDTPEEAQPGDTVVIRSHGVGQWVYDALDRRGIQTVDATCPFVAKIHRIVSEHSAQGDTVIIAGDKNHPEVLGIQGHCTGECFVIKDGQELAEVLSRVKNRVILVAQTTFHAEFWRNCVEIAKKLCTNIIFFDTICNATNERQTEARLLARQNELMVVIGGRESSNTRKLGQVCSEEAETWLVETAQELAGRPLAGYRSIGVTAGASTPAYIIKEVLKTMSEMLNKQDGEMDFATLLEQSLESEKLYPGKRVKGIVTTVLPNEVHVDIGAKQAGVVPADELTEDPGQTTSDVVSKGDEIELVVMKVNDQEGLVTLSKKRCDAAAGFEEIKKALEDGTVLSGTVVNVVKGGVLALSNHIKVFIPASQVSNRRVEDLSTLLKTDVRFKVLEVNERRGRALGSVRAVLDAEKKEKEEKFWSEVEIGKVYKGEVKSLTSYGAFVDLGGVDGMIHITELSWTKIKHPSEIVNVGDIVEVYVKDLDPEKHRISLGFKKAEDNPWVIFQRDYHVGDVVKVKIVSFTNYGAFATIIPGIDGLIHISQIANQRVEKISDILEIGQEVDAKIIDINFDAKRVSLSMRALLPEEDQKITRESDSDVVYSSDDGIISEELAADIEAAEAEKDE